LSGAIRAVGQTEARLKEAQKLGLSEAVLAGGGEMPRVKDVSARGLETVADLVAWAASRSKGLRRIA
jgi:DNA repair protein RadA/Sms